MQKASLFGISGVPGLLFGKDSKHYFSMDAFRSVLNDKGYEIEYEEIFYWPYEMPLKYLPRMPFAMMYYYLKIRKANLDYAQKILTEYVTRINALAKKSDKIFIFAHSAGTVFTQRLLLDERLDLGKCKICPVLVAVPNQILYGARLVNKLIGGACIENDIKNIKCKTVMMTGQFDPLSGPNIPGCDQNKNLKHFGPLKVKKMWEYIPGLQHTNLMTEDYADVYAKAVEFLDN